MATPSASTHPTLLDLTRAQDPNGAIAAVAEILTETNEMLLDIPFMEGNLATGHRTTVRTGIPEPTWRMFYGGVQPTKSTRAQIDDSTAMLEAYAEVDKALADLNGNTSAFRLSEDYAHLEGMSQAAQQAFIYGNQALDPNQFNGLAPRFNSLSAGNKDNIIDAGGSSTDNASIWLVVWGQNTVHGIYPKGLTGGLSMQDLGEQTLEASNGGYFQGYRTHYSWKLGLTVRDWRYVVRIANIDRSDLNATATGDSANLPELMFEATERLPSLSAGQAVYYMDRTVRTKLRQQMASGVKQSTLTTEQLGGIRTVMFDEIPIRRVDRLAVNEARIT